jgi:regulator of protease activity HflC (stomatin/prohibitin superfamily)
VDSTSLIVALVIALAVIFILASSIRVVRQQRVGMVERLGRFNRTLEPGPHLLIPVLDKVRYNLDMRENVIPFPPQGVITEDNLMVGIDSVIYFQIVDPERAAYEAQDYVKAIEQLTQTTLRNIIGGLDLEQTLTSREEINQKLRVVLDEATGKWGIKVNRVELRAIEPPPTIRDAMEKGARAERDKRAAILIAEGQRQSNILSAGGEKESAILRAQGDREAAVLRAQADRQAQMLRAEGEAQAIGTVFNAIHAGQPDQALLSYQYLQMLPQLAKGDANKMWIVPSELNDALKGLGGIVGQTMGGTSAAPSANGIPAASGSFTAPPKIDVQAEIEQQSRADEEASRRTVAEAIAAAAELERPNVRPHATSNGGNGNGNGSGHGMPAVTDGRENAAPSEQSAAASTAASTVPETVEEAASVQR